MSAKRTRRELADVEIKQREALRKRLAGRKRKPSREIFEDCGAPMLHEDNPMTNEKQTPHAGAPQPGTQIADAILARIAKRYENCKVNIYPEMPCLTPVEAVLRCAQEEGFVLTNAAAPRPAPAPGLRERLAEILVCESCEGTGMLSYPCTKHDEGEPQLECTCGEFVCPDCEGTKLHHEFEKIFAACAALTAPGLRELLTECEGFLRAMPVDDVFSTEWLLARKTLADKLRAALTAPVPTPQPDYTWQFGKAPAPVPPTHCECTALKGRGICNLCADMLRQQVYSAREVSAAIAQSAAPMPQSTQRAMGASFRAQIAELENDKRILIRDLTKMADDRHYYAAHAAAPAETQPTQDVFRELFDAIDWNLCDIRAVKSYDDYLAKFEAAEIARAAAPAVEATQEELTPYCAWCGEPYSFGHTCAFVPAVEGDVTKCPRCEGSGRYVRVLRLPSGPVEICAVCEGHGWLDENGKGTEPNFDQMCEADERAVEGE